MQSTTEILDWALRLEVGNPHDGDRLQSLIATRLQQLGRAHGERRDAEIALRGQLSIVYRVQGDPERALEHALQGLRRIHERSDPRAAALVYQAIAQVMLQVGHHSEALDYLERALEEDIPTAQRLGIAINRASVLRSMQQLHDASKAFDALVRRQSELDPVRRALLLINAASTWRQVERHSEARSALDQAEAILAPTQREDLGQWVQAIRTWIAADEGAWEEAWSLGTGLLAADSEVPLAVQISVTEALARAGLGHPPLLEPARVHIEHLLDTTSVQQAKQQCATLHQVASEVAEALGDLPAVVRHLRLRARAQVELERARRRMRSQGEALRLELARAQIAQDTLSEQQRALQQAHAALTQSEVASAQSTRALAHDLRSPLTVVRVTAELLDDATPEELAHHREQLIAASDRMEEILDAALNPPDPHRTGSTRVVALTHQILANFRAVSASQLLRFVGPPGPEVVLDAPRSTLVRILDNLLSNAVKHAPPRSTVTVSIQSCEQHVVLCVRDEGPGFQGSANTALLRGLQQGEAPGHGLGLNTVHRLASELGGVVQLDNHPEGGAQVTVLLPR